MNIDKLWKIYQNTRTNENRNKLVSHYLYLVDFHVLVVQQKTQYIRSKSELSSAAYVGLIESVQSFNLQRNIKFKTFANFRIRGAIWDWIREIDSHSRSIRTFEKKKNQFQSDIKQNDYNDLEIETAKKMNISYQRYTKRNAIFSCGNMIHLSDLAYNNDNFDVTDQSCRSSDNNQCFIEELIGRGLKKNECTILILYYYDGLSTKEIGKKLGYSTSRIAQIKNEALYKARKNLQKSGFKCLKSVL